MTIEEQLAHIRRAVGPNLHAAIEQYIRTLAKASDMTIADIQFEREFIAGDRELAEANTFTYTLVIKGFN